MVRPPPLLREYRRARSTNRAGQPSEPFSWAWAGAVCLGFAAMAPPGAAEEGARSRCLRRPTTTMPGGGRAVKTGRTRPCPMPIRSRDVMSKAPAIYCRGRADGVRGDEATYLSMTVRHGHSRRARRPLATASLFSAAPPRPVAGRTPWSCWSPHPTAFRSPPARASPLPAWGPSSYPAPCRPPPEKRW